MTSNMLQRFAVILLNMHNEVINMNAVLIETLLSLIPAAFNYSTSKNG
jgi:hypothetical protein